MKTQTRLELRFGLLALGLSGLLFVLSIAVRGPLDRNPASLMAAALSSNFVPGVTIGLIGGLVHIYGLFGLYRYLTYRRQSLTAFLAVVLSPLGIVLVLPLLTFLAVDVPVIAELYRQGHQEVLAVFKSNFVGLGLAVLGVSSATGSIGALLFAVAIWRDGELSKWAGVLFGLSGILLALGGPGFFVVELLGALCLLISAGMIAWKGWQESMAAEGEIAAPPAVPDRRSG